VVTAGVALYFAALRDEDVPVLAAYVAARGRSRAAADAATAAAHLATAVPAEREAAYRAARNLVQQTHRKEAGALRALRPLARRGRGLELAAQAERELEGSLSRELDALERAYTAIAGKPVPNLNLSSAERAMAAKLFVPVADPSAFADASEKAKPVTGLHSLMRFETLNFADGKRSAWEVYEAVAAEALSAGEWYYGKVEPADVLETLERAAKEGAFTVRAVK
jgi:hypothetical protein